MIGNKAIVSLTIVFSCLGRSSGQELSTGQDLFDQYGVIFPHGNRNAASHRWATYIIERSSSLDEETIQGLFSHFCPVSGSPIGALRDLSRKWTVALPSVSGGAVSGVTYLCCWPCICDAQDWIFVDTKTITTASGEQRFNFLVIGNPCVQPESIPTAAPDVTCDGGELEGATLSDNGYVIIGMLHDQDEAAGNHADEASEVCQQRAESGYNSGMGQIFIQVAAISPIAVGVVGDTAQLSGSDTDQSNSTAVLVSNAIEAVSHVHLHNHNQSNDDVAERAPEESSWAAPPRVRVACAYVATCLALVLQLLS